MPGVVRMCKGLSGVALSCLASGYTRIARASQELKGGCQEWPGVERRLSGVARGCQEIPGVVRSFQDVPGAVRECQKESGDFRMFQGLSGVQGWPNNIAFF